jgi:phospholipase C
MDDGGFLASLKADIVNGTLPQVSWIVAPADYSEHPGPSSPVQGGWYTQEVLNALTQDPEIWSKTVLIINFDENDGFFDHMPPPCAPAILNGEVYGESTIDTAGEYHTDGHPYGPGPRVPALIVSPWSRGGWVNSQVFDHTSVIQFLEARFGVIEDNITPFRRAVCGDLQSAFNFRNPNTEQLPDLPQIEKSEADEIRSNQENLPQLNPPSEDEQQLPYAVRGVRPSRALPYELYVDAVVDSDNYRINVMMDNAGEQAIVVHVYDLFALDLPPRRFAIGAGDRLDATWFVTNEQGEYDLWILAANGFHRQFKGTITPQTKQEVAVSYVTGYGDPFISVRMRNDTPEPAFLRFEFAMGGRNRGREVVIDAFSETTIRRPLMYSYNWYDFFVTNADASFYRRYCGRVEDGSHTSSDPLLGVASESWPENGFGYRHVARRDLLVK